MAIDIPYQVIGREEQSAKDYIQSYSLRWRVVKRDGIPFIVTGDVDGNRINLSIDKGTVTKASRG